MNVDSEIIWAIAITAIAFLAGVLLARPRSRRTRTRSLGKLQPTDTPADLRFVCASCAQRFTHSRRTLRAWQSGERSFYCNACRTRTQLARPVSPSVSGRPSASPDRLRKKNEKSSEPKKPAAAKKAAPAKGGSKR